MQYFLRTDESTTQGEWWTEKQIMSFNGYPDEKMDGYADVKTALLEGLTERDHEVPAMAKLGIKQYEYFRKKTGQSSGSKTEDTMAQSSEVDEKSAEKMCKLFDSGNFAVQREDLPPVIQVEPWKRAAMDCEKKVLALQSRVARGLQTSQSLCLKLERLADAGNQLAEAHKDNLGSKRGVLAKALEEFQRTLASVDSKTEERSAHMIQVAEPAMATLKEHCSNFEKVLNISKQYHNMCD